MTQHVIATDVRPETACARACRLIAALRDAAPGSDIAVMGGRNHETGESVVLVQFGGDRLHHAFTPAETRKIADLFERSMRDNPDDPEAMALPDIIMALRAAADVAEKGRAS